LHDLLQYHGPDRLRAAFEDGLQSQIFGAHYVERSLRQPDLFSVEGMIQ